MISVNNSQINWGFDFGDEDSWERKTEWEWKCMHTVGDCDLWRV